jgi:hypothetical protein
MMIVKMRSEQKSVLFRFIGLLRSQTKNSTCEMLMTCSNTMSSTMTTHDEAAHEPQPQSSLKINAFFYTTTVAPTFHGASAIPLQASAQEPHRHSHSFPQARNSHNRLNRSQSASIPIAPHSMRRTASENQLSEDEAEADYKDFLFYNRVVKGISSKQRLVQDGSLKHENQQCLESIVRARHDEDLAAAAASSRYWYYPTKDYHPNSLREADRLIHVCTMSPEVFALSPELGSSRFPVEEEGIFDLEL